MAKDPAFVQQYLGSQEASDLGVFFADAAQRRLSYLGGLLSLLMVLFPAAALLAGGQRSAAVPRFQTQEARSSPRASDAEEGQQIETHEPDRGDLPYPFILLLIIIGSLVVLAPEFVFLRDQFVSRLNTIFKFYYQAWLLWSIAAAFGVAVLLQNLRGTMDWIFRSALALLLILSLTYPVLALYNKTNGFNPPLGWTLDDFVRIERSNPDEAAAIRFLKLAPLGVVAEAVGGQYSGFARISEYTGLPAVLGWPGHESEWRGTSEQQGTRQDDMALLYSTASWETALSILGKYDIRYVYIGGLERSTYTVQEMKFQQNMAQVFQRGAVTIYEMP
jgi:uncharacterized membrane protein